jgi:hypothetical protein
LFEPIEDTWQATTQFWDVFVFPRIRSCVATTSDA